MKTLELLSSTLVSAENFRERHPADQAIASIVNQLKFLIELEQGTRTGWNRIKDLTLGVLAVREIEPLDKSLAEHLYKVLEEVSQMQSQGRKGTKDNRR
jgi:hypothetical protein